MAQYEEPDGHLFAPVPLQTHLTMSPYWLPYDEEDYFLDAILRGIGKGESIP
jgi:hypothetical protein